MTALVQLARLPEEASGDDVRTSVLFAGLESLSRGDSLEALGSPDFTISAREYAARRSDSDMRRVRVVAVADPGGRRIEEWMSAGPRVDEGGRWRSDADIPEGRWTPEDVVGAVLVAAPLTHDIRSADIQLSVAAAWRESGLPDLLARIGEVVAVELGRSVLQAWTLSPEWAQTGSPQAVAGVATPVPGDPDVASPARTWSTDLLGRWGYRPVHAEWVTCLDIDQALAERDAGGSGPVGGYELVSWSSPRSPEHLVDQLAGIYALAATDMPSGEMTVEPGAWDGDRVTRKESLAERVGQHWVTTAVRPVGGHLVGWTTLVISPNVPEVVFQEGTLVRADHRRRGLAAWMKRVNLVELRARHPRARRVHTWTAGDNTPVIALNTRIGFRPVAVETGWEKSVDTPLAPPTTASPAAVPGDVS